MKELMFESIVSGEFKCKELWITEDYNPAKPEEWFGREPTLEEIVDPVGFKVKSGEFLPYEYIRDERQWVEM